MSDRQQSGLRGPVKSYTEESTYPGAADVEGKTYPNVHSEYTSEYDMNGRIAAARHTNSDSVSYSYDAEGRVNHTSRRIFNQEEEIESTYNEHGDISSEITRSTRKAEDTALPSYSEVHYSYRYDYHDNWVEKAISYRSSPDGAFQPSTVVKRSLTYY